MISRFFRHLFEALKSLKRNGWMTVAAVSSVMITLTLVAIFASVIFNTAKLATDIENNVRVVVYIRKDVEDNSQTIEKEGQTVTNNDYHKVYDSLKNMSTVKSVTFSSKEEQYEKLTEIMGDNWKIFEGDANPLYDAYIVEANTPNDVKTIAEDAKKIEGVSEVQDGGANTERLFKLASFIRVWGLGIATLLIFIAVFLISNTIRITIISRSREIQIMRLVGAINSYIRGPFLLEGAFIGLLGAIAPSVLVFIVYQIVYQSVNKSLVGQNLSMISPDLFSPLMIALLFVIGVFIGSLGSGISMRRFLKI
ncbi:TPA: ABC transporter permease [Streptococcus pneumoniae]|nr:ABC transporter permease [Streptococcus pneumoniae]